MSGEEKSRDTLRYITVLQYRILLNLHSSSSVELAGTFPARLFKSWNVIQTQTTKFTSAVSMHSLCISGLSCWNVLNSRLCFQAVLLIA